MQNREIQMRMTNTDNSDARNKMTSIDDEFRMAAEKVRRTNGGIPAEYISRYDFVSLGEKVADAMIEAAQEQVTAAQNKLEEIRAFADDIRQQIKAKDKELTEMTDRIKTLGERVLEANREFNASLPPLDPLPKVVTAGPRKE
jgi:septation ring formation regulator EzrA